ncbi:helix-turn-helix domain protein [Gracilinema caldarium DSM 7334]|uniref:Helix-turn-helix domain protein n=2 Tax=Gracilinema caldarium TaxID=215591 RepID=F8F1K6_GRAC1|nr:helix-turn-helix domain protein [Gracilinema caldarium DSM 7334]
MEFKDRLQTLRKKNGMTQEQLSERLNISRTAVSKWESGRGMPNIEALKRLSEVFGVSLDELLSGKELLDAAENEGRERVGRQSTLTFGLLDLLACCFAFLPFFSQPRADYIATVSLFEYSQARALKIAFFAALGSMGAWGLAALAVPVSLSGRLRRFARFGSLALHSAAIALFIAAREPYAAFFLFVLLLAKVVLIALENR